MPEWLSIDTIGIDPAFAHRDEFSSRAVLPHEWRRPSKPTLFRLLDSPQGLAGVSVERRKPPDIGMLVRRQEEAVPVNRRRRSWSERSDLGRVGDRLIDLSAPHDLTAEIDGGQQSGRSVK